MQKFGPLPVAATLVATAALLVCSSAAAIDVLAACRFEAPKYSAVLLDLRCPSANECWPDPDDVSIEFLGQDGESYAIDDMAWLDAKGRASSKAPDGYPARAVWSMPQDSGLKARRARLVYDGEPITRTFDLNEEGCAAIPAAALKLLKITLPAPSSGAPAKAK